MLSRILNVRCQPGITTWLELGGRSTIHKLDETTTFSQLSQSKYSGIILLGKDSTPFQHKMHSFLIAASSLLVHTTLAAFATPLLGPTYPPPTDLTSSSSSFLKAWQNLTSTLDHLVAADTTVEGDFHDLGSYTFSIQAFSLHDTSAVQTLQYHHTGVDVSNTSNVSNSVHQVNANSVYRIGSVSKVFSVYLTLLEIGPQYWDRSIVDFVPGLVSSDNGRSHNPITDTNWTGVTLGALAGQVAGILRGVAPSNVDVLEYTSSASGPDPIAFGFPPLNTSDPTVVPSCLQSYFLNNTYCNSSDYVRSVIPRYPVYPSWASPSYSNAAYNLLAVAVESITNRSFGAMMQTDLFQVLNMSSSYYYPPSNLTHAVIPGSDPTTGFSLNFGAEIPDGGMYSTTNDMSRFGISILNSTLLDAGTTAQWLKPISHTATLQASVGRPWEIFRVQGPSNSRIIDLYTKSGDISSYSSWLILSPDHGAGFIILGAGLRDISGAVSIITDLVMTTLVSALETEAAAEASLNIAGEYTAPASSGLNSSMTLSVNPTLGYGLSVTNWISNGTDFLHDTWSFFGVDELSLFPTGLTTTMDDGIYQSAFRATMGNSTQNTSHAGPASNLANKNWIGLDGEQYGGIGLDLFILTFNASGYATAVSPAALRVTLDRAE